MLEHEATTPAVALQRARRVVVKVGSAVLTANGAGLDAARIATLAGELFALGSERQVVLVSSGAVAAGFSKLGITSKRRGAALPLKQAAAAVGQSSMMWAYESAFAKFGIKVAQVLLTAEDLANRTRFLNARSTMGALLEHAVLPIVNENDTVAVSELKFGDNDNLAAMVCHLVDADLLIILSDIAGLYTKDPKRDRAARLIPVVARIDQEIEALAGGTLGVGTGGMSSKILAARKVTSRGLPMIITSGHGPRPLGAIGDNDFAGTLFLPKKKRVHGRKYWIANLATPRGTLMVDDGAHAALVTRGKSLLPSGITAVSGSFKVGDCVACVDSQNRTFARGLTRYASFDLMRVKGLKTSEVAAVIGHKDYDEVIHRDDLALLDQG